MVDSPVDEGGLDFISVLDGSLDGALDSVSGIAVSSVVDEVAVSVIGTSSSDMTGGGISADLTLAGDICAGSALDAPQFICSSTRFWIEEVDELSEDEPDVGSPVCDLISASMPGSEGRLDLTTVTLSGVCWITWTVFSPSTDV